MTQPAHNYKKHDYFYDEKDHEVYNVLDKKETGKHRTVHFDVVTFSGDHKTSRVYAHDHHLLKVEPKHTSYVISHLLDLEEDKQFLCLVDKHGNHREDLYIKDLDNNIDELKKLLDKKEEVHANVLSLHIDKLHRDGKDYDKEVIHQISSINMKHMSQSA